MDARAVTVAEVEDGMRLEISYPIDEYESGSEFYFLVPGKPDDLFREGRILHADAGQVYETGTVLDPLGQGKAVAWRIH